MLLRPDSSLCRALDDTLDGVSNIWQPSDKYQFPKQSSPFSQEPPDGTRSQGCSLLPLDRPVAFEHEVEFESKPLLKAHSRQGAGVHYNAKVCRATLGPCMELVPLDHRRQ